MKKSTLVMGAVLLLASVLTAETVMIRSVSGDVRMKSGNAWVPVKAGAKIDDAVLLRIPDNARVQVVNASGTMISIAEAREASVKDLFLSVTNPKMFARLNLLKDKLGRGGSKDGMGPTAVAGVRGADVYAQNKEALKRELYWEE